MSPPISIVVPTYREADNILPLAGAVDEAMTGAGLSFEMIIVDDDSRDGIDAAVRGIENRFPVRLKIRTRERGLSSAVVEGFRLAAGDVLVVMDADLSHPPGCIPGLVGPILAGRADFVMSSRFMEGGSAAHFNWYRRGNARVSRFLARPLVRVSDPMAGFFALRRRVLRPEIPLDPLGFKIGLEVLVKMRPRRIAEVPIRFGERLHGESKLSLREQWNYLRHLGRLYAFHLRNRPAGSPP